MSSTHNAPNTNNTTALPITIGTPVVLNTMHNYDPPYDDDSNGTYSAELYYKWTAPVDVDMIVHTLGTADAADIGPDVSVAERYNDNAFGYGPLQFGDNPIGEPGHTFTPFHAKAGQEYTFDVRTRFAQSGAPMQFTLAVQDRQTFAAAQVTPWTDQAHLTAAWMPPGAYSFSTATGIKGYIGGEDALQIADHPDPRATPAYSLDPNVVAPPTPIADGYGFVAVVSTAIDNDQNTNALKMVFLPTDLERPFSEALYAELVIVSIFDNPNDENNANGTGIGFYQGGSYVGGYSVYAPESDWTEHPQGLPAITGLVADDEFSGTTLKMFHTGLLYLGTDVQGNAVYGQPDDYRDYPLFLSHVAMRIIWPTTELPQPGGDSGNATGVTRWTLTDTTSSDSYTFPINPLTMSPVGPQGTLKRVRGQYGVVSQRQVPTQQQFQFGGKIRDQEHYDALLTWTDKRVPVIVRDHLGRRFRVYLTSFAPQDRSVIPKAPKRWTYTVTGTLLEGPL